MADREMSSVNVFSSSSPKDDMRCWEMDFYMWRRCGEAVEKVRTHR